MASFSCCGGASAVFFLAAIALPIATLQTRKATTTAKTTEVNSQLSHHPDELLRYRIDSTQSTSCIGVPMNKKSLDFSIQDSEIMSSREILIRGHKKGTSEQAWRLTLYPPGP